MRHVAIRVVADSLPAVVERVHAWERWAPALGVLEFEGKEQELRLRMAGPSPFEVMISLECSPGGLTATLVEGALAALSFEVTVIPLDEGTQVQLSLVWQPPLYVPGAFQRSIDDDLLPRVMDVLLNN